MAARKAKAAKAPPYEVIKVRGGNAGIVGYARVSTRDQNLAGQVADLRKAGCCRIYTEKVSSVGPRLGWAALVDTLRPGDVVTVVRLDRIGRRLVEVVGACNEVLELGAHVHAVAQGVNTRGPGGRHQIPWFAALAETEREILRERTRAGLAAAAASGRVGGRPPKRSPAKDELIRHLRAQGHSFRAIAKAVDLGVATVRRAIDDGVKGDPRQLKLLGGT